MKRSLSDSSTPPSSPLVTPKSQDIPSDDEYASSDPSTPTPASSKKRARAQPLDPKTHPKKQKGQQEGSPSVKKRFVGNIDWEAGWTPDKKEALVDRLLEVGWKSVN